MAMNWCRLLEEHAAALRRRLDTFWSKSLHDGWFEGTAFDAKVSYRESDRAHGSPASPQGIELNFRRDPTIYDRHFSNNGWLQELP